MSARVGLGRTLNAEWKEGWGRQLGAHRGPKQRVGAQRRQGQDISQGAVTGSQASLLLVEPQDIQIPLFLLHPWTYPHSLWVPSTHKTTQLTLPSLCCPLTPNHVCACLLVLSCWWGHGLDL